MGRRRTRKRITCRPLSAFVRVQSWGKSEQLCVAAETLASEKSCYNRTCIRNEPSMRHRLWSRVYRHVVALLKGDLMHEIHDALHALIERVPTPLRALPAPIAPSAPDGSSWSR